MAVSACLGIFQPRPATAITIPGTASGAFGTPVGGGTDFVLGYTFAAPETVQIVASGIVFMGSGSILPTGPDGLTLLRSNVMGPFPTAYTPLEEALVDGGTPPPISDPSSTVLNQGALIAAFVSEATATLPGFAPRDEDVTAIGIASSALFLVGSGPFIFSAPGSGRLYLGFNEPFVSNNSGTFDVTITPIPEPGTLSLLCFGLLFRVIRDGRRRTMSRARALG